MESIKKAMRSQPTSVRSPDIANEEHQQHHCRIRKKQERRPNSSTGVGLNHSHNQEPKEKQKEQDQTLQLFSLRRLRSSPAQLGTSHTTALLSSDMQPFSNARVTAAS